MWHTAFVFWAGWCFATVPSYAGPPVDELTPFSATNYNWKAEAPGASLGPQDVARLEKDKILISDETFSQIFSPYIESTFPLFITTDSLLNGFHVLFEESVQRLEYANEPKLRRSLISIWGELGTIERYCKGRPELVAAARKRAQMVVGVALRLADPAFRIEDEGLRKAVEKDAARVVEATAHDKPGWLGPADPGFMEMDYTRFKPRGFYTGDASLERYFRAVSWLQAIPFRVNRDEELLAFWMIGRSLNLAEKSNRSRGNYRDRFEFFQPCDRLFLGRGDDWDLVSGPSNFHFQYDLDFTRKANDFAEYRNSILKAAKKAGDPGSQVNDQVQLPPGDPSQIAEPQFRILSASRIPDGVLFQRTTDPRSTSRPFPSGLEVAAALGSPFAVSQLSHDKEGSFVTRTVEANKKLFEPSGLYSVYLDCLKSLADSPDRDAPAFMKAEAWHRKSCQTILAGWAQLRHTWVLQAKENVLYAGLTEKPAGFVEPNPEFYSRFAHLISTTAGLLEENGAFRPNVSRHAPEVRKAAQFLVDHGFTKSGQNASRKLRGDNERQWWQSISYAQMVTKSDLMGKKPPSPADCARIVSVLRQLASDLESGKITADSPIGKGINAMDMDLGPLWNRLELMTRRLETLAHKQLRKLPFDNEENGFIQEYGELLAGVMLYGGNSYEVPRDDAPRAVDVFTNPNAKSFLIEAIGRPHPIYVLYPYENREVLCRGAVMPYYEFTHGQRLNDQEWKTMLGSPAAPQQPEWVGSVSAKLPLPPEIAERVAYEKRESEAYADFMSAFPEKAKAVFEEAREDTMSGEGLEAGEKKLTRKAAELRKLFTDEFSFGRALTRSLGKLSKGGAQTGSWGCSSSKEQLVLMCGKSLKGATFQKLLESGDEEILLGAARLFFFENLDASLSVDQRGPAAAKLCAAVLRSDHRANGDLALRGVGHYPGSETSTLLEQVALGQISWNPLSHDKEDPSPPAAACLLLARTGAPGTRDCIRKVESAGKPDACDKAALLIAHSFAGERGLLDKSIFAIDSYTIGFGALAALEKEGGPAALDAVIVGGTAHHWAAVSQEAVLTVERMSGKKWVKNLKNERPDWYVKDIQEWWKQNRSSFMEKGAAK